MPGNAVVGDGGLSAGGGIWTLICPFPSPGSPAPWEILASLLTSGHGENRPQRESGRGRGLPQAPPPGLSFPTCNMKELSRVPWGESSDSETSGASCLPAPNPPVPSPDLTHTRTHTPHRREHLCRPGTTGTAHVVSLGRGSFCHVDSAACVAANEIKKYGGSRPLNFLRPDLHSRRRPCWDGSDLSKHTVPFPTVEPSPRWRGGGGAGPGRGKDPADGADSRLQGKLGLEARRTGRRAESHRSITFYHPDVVPVDHVYC